LPKFTKITQSMRKNYCTVFESDKMSSVNAADIDLIELLVDNVILDFVNV